MGLFSTIYNSYIPLGMDFIGDFQTKDLQCLMDEYWISPSGELFLISYSNCFRAIANEYPKNFLDVLSWESTGLNGCISPCDETGVVNIYTSCDGQWKEADLYLKKGRISLILNQKREPLSR